MFIIFFNSIFHLRNIPQVLKGTIIQFRRGRHTIHERHYLIEIEGITNKEQAKKLKNKEVVWKSPAGKIIEGKISSPHGNKGIVRAIFKKGLPGQAVTTNVEILDNIKINKKEERR